MLSVMKVAFMFDFWLIRPTHFIAELAWVDQDLYELVELSKVAQVSNKFWLLPPGPTKRKNGLRRCLTVHKSKITVN